MSQLEKTPHKKIAIIGASGLVGSKLYRTIDRTEYHITVVGRSLAKLRQRFPDAISHMTWDAFKASSDCDYETIVNLAGSSVSGAKWTNNYKESMIKSRLDSTRLCVKKCIESKNTHLINASAVSAYGSYAGASIRFTEINHADRSGPTFLRDLVDNWEAETSSAKAHGNPVTLLRTGVVLDAKDGALPKMMKPFKVLLGGPIGTGQQMISWISSEDIARTIAFLIQHRDITGPVNCTSPGACTNQYFAEALGHALNRPSFFITPAFYIRATMGQMGDELIVKGQHVYPEKLVEAGFQFRHNKIDDYFSDVVLK